MGIAGAAIATDLSMVASFIAYIVLMSRDEYDRRYRTRHGWRLDPVLFSRILRFGLPSGIQFFIDMAGFTVFLLIIGRLGTVSLAATNIALNINTLAFMPMIGLGMTVGILVGQHLGRDQPDLAERCVLAGFHLTMLYMGSVALLYVLVPGLFLAPFGAYAAPGAYTEIRGLAVVLLRFVALYSLFDVLNIVFASALKGAGDTRFVMYLIAVLSTGILIIPSYVAIEVLGAGILATWAIGTAYVSILGIAMYFRYKAGTWKRMRVIERQPLRAE
jgi:MATE family multidrug resistance protein